MPSFFAYGVRATLNAPNSTSSSAPLSESARTITWSPSSLMTHPIYTSTVTSPATQSSGSIPLEIVLEFENDPDIPSHIKGDVRVEITIDGVVRAIRIFREGKIRCKEGFKIAFAGTRVGRTEELGFVFLPLPDGTTKFSSASNGSVTTSPCNSTTPVGNLTAMAPIGNSNTLLADPPDSMQSTPPGRVNPFKTATTPPHRDPSLVPPAPANLPPNTSFIEVLLTIGKKHKTLDKYLIDSPIQQKAFYIPPTPGTPLETVSSRFQKRQNGGVALLAVGRTRMELRTPHTPSNLRDILLPDLSAVHADIEVESIQDKSGDEDNSSQAEPQKPTEWKPIGLSSKTQKTVQTKEVEFTGRIQLARFWFIVVPSSKFHIPQQECHITPKPNPNPSNNLRKIVVLKMSKEKLQEKLQEIADADEKQEVEKNTGTGSGGNTSGAKGKRAFILIDAESKSETDRDGIKDRSVKQTYSNRLQGRLRGLGPAEIKEHNNLEYQRFQEAMKKPPKDLESPYLTGKGNAIHDPYPSSPIKRSDVVDSSTVQGESSSRKIPDASSSLRPCLRSTKGGLRIGGTEHNGVGRPKKTPREVEPTKADGNPRKKSKITHHGGAGQVPNSNNDDNDNEDHPIEPPKKQPRLKLVIGSRGDETPAPESGGTEFRRHTRAEGRREKAAAEKRQ